MNAGLLDAYGSPSPPANSSPNPITKPSMAAGRYYTYPFLTSSSGATTVANRLYAVPFFVSEVNTFTKIGIDVSLAAGNARLGIYNMDSDAMPSTLVLDAGAVSMGSTGEKEITINQALNVGWYYLVCVFDTAAAQVLKFNSTGAGSFVFGAQTAAGLGSELAPYVALTYGALPNLFGTATLAAITAEHPMIWMRI